MGSGRLGQWLYILLVGVLILLKAEGLNVGITYVVHAVAKGAGEFFCFHNKNQINFHFYRNLYFNVLGFLMMCSLFGWESAGLPSR